MSGSEPSEDEWAGLDVVRRVVEVANYKRLVPSGRDGARTPVRHYGKRPLARGRDQKLGAANPRL